MADAVYNTECGVTTAPQVPRDLSHLPPGAQSFCNGPVYSPTPPVVIPEGDLCEACRERRIVRYDGRGRGVCERCLGPCTLVRNHPRTGRNEPCDCGSGVKRKRCCGKNRDTGG